MTWPSAWNLRIGQPVWSSIQRLSRERQRLLGSEHIHGNGHAEPGGSHPVAGHDHLALSDRRQEPGQPFKVTDIIEHHQAARPVRLQPVPDRLSGGFKVRARLTDTHAGRHRREPIQRRASRGDPLPRPRYVSTSPAPASIFLEAGIALDRDCR
jgi:hypothetical protein